MLKVISQDGQDVHKVESWYLQRVDYDSHYAYYIIARTTDSGELILAEYGSLELAEKVLKQMIIYEHDNKEYKLPQENELR